MNAQAQAQHQGDENQEGNDVVVGNTERNNDANDLAEQLRQRRDQEMADAGEEVIDTSGQTGDDEGEVEPTPPAAEDDTTATGDGQQQAAEAGAATPPTDEVITLTVDGEKRDVPVSEVLEAGKRTMQIDDAAERRLEKANQILREAREHNQGQPPTSGAAHTPQAAPAIDAEQVAYNIRYGNEEEAAKAIEQLAVGRDQATQMSGMPQEQLLPLIQDTMAYNSAVELLERPSDQGGYGDLWNEPTMRGLFIQREQQVRALAEQNGTALPGYRELYTAIGDDLRKWKDSMASPATTAAVTLTDKTARKKGLDVPPVAGGRSTANTSGSEVKPKSRKEILAEMAASRAQDF